MRPALAFAVLAALVGGLVFIANRNTQEPADESPSLPDTRYVIGDVLDGYEPAGAVGPGAGPGLSFPIRWFGPEDGASSVVLVLDISEGHDDEWLDSQLSEYVDEPVESTVNGQRVVLADSNEFGDDAPRSMFVQVAPDRWVNALSRGVDDEALQDLAAGFSIDGAGRVALDESFLPQGLVAVGDGPLAYFQGFSSARTGSELPPYPLHQTGVLYTQGSMQSEVIALFAAPQPQLLQAQALLILGAPTPASRPDTLLFSSEAIGITEILFESNGVSFALVAGPTVTVAQLEEMADSVRPATPTEWLDLQTALQVFLEVGQSSESVTEAAQAWPAFDASLVGSVLAAGALQDGRPWSLQLGASSDDEYLAQLWIDGEEYGSWGPLGNSGFGVVVTPMGEYQVVLAVWPATDQPPSLTVSQPGLDDIVLELSPLEIDPSYVIAAVVVSGDAPVTGVLSDEAGELARS